MRREKPGPFREEFDAIALIRPIRLTIRNFRPILSYQKDKGLQARRLAADKLNAANLLKVSGSMDKYTIAPCIMKACAYYLPEPSSSQMCRCTHPEKPNYMEGRCPLYKLDWKKASAGSASMQPRRS